MILGLDVPPVSHLVRWPNFGGDIIGINKVVVLEWLAAILVFALFRQAARQRKLVPAGVQNVAESVVEFIREGIILQTMGPEGLAWTPFLLTMFCFVFVCNIYEIIPGIQMPVTARMAVPLFLALVVFVIYHFVGIRSQGFFKYWKSGLIPPGVPKAIIPLVAFIELLGLIFTRPFSLAVRLFANLLAGHLLLVTFSVLTAALFSSTYIGAVVPGALLIALFGFELLVSVLQAFIFTILTAVYIGGAMHPEH